MGNSGSSRGPSEFSGHGPRNAPLLYHTTHSENCILSPDKRIARRAESYCKGICFTNRPIAIGERVYLKFSEVSTSWSGVLRFGLTSRDPSTINGTTLPRYACPDLSNKPGNWAKALSERYGEPNNIVYFYVTRSGDVMFGINGEEKGVFFSGVSTTVPLWGIIDIYGNTIAVEILDCRQMMQTEGRYSSDLVPPFNNLNVTPPAQHSPQPIHAQQNHNQLVLRQQQQQHVLPPPQPARPAAPPPVRFHRDVRFTPLPFHTMSGKNVCLSSDRSLAFRPSDEYCNAYVFTSKPLRCGEKIVIQILGIDRTYVGGLAFGLTACDPSALTPSELPDDSDLLLDRPEYWVVNKDVCSLAELGDELSFTMSSEGEVYYGRNGRHIAVLMHVDKTLPLWAFFDVYGNTQKIKMLGLAGPTIPRPVRSESAGGSSRSSSSSGLTVALPRENSAPMLPPRNPILPPQRSTSASAEMSTPPHVEPRRPIRPPLSPEPLIPLSVAPAPPTPQQVADGVMDMPSHNPPPLPERSMSTDSSRDRIEDDDYNPNECTVCYENPVDSVLYKCGHMCMCYNCAYDVVNQQGSLCPICRQPIVDVVKIYRS